jgi:hypothetical protein
MPDSNLTFWENHLELFFSRLRFRLPHFHDPCDGFRQ